MALYTYKTLRHCLSRFLFILAVSYILCLLSFIRLEQYSYQLQQTPSSSGKFIGEIRQSGYDREIPHSKNSKEKTGKSPINIDSVGGSTRIGASRYKAVFLRRLKQSNGEALESARSHYDMNVSAEKSYRPHQSPEISHGSQPYSFSPMPSSTKSEGENIHKATGTPEKITDESSMSAPSSKNCSNREEFQSTVSESIVLFKNLGEDFYVYGVYLDDRYFPETYVRVMVLRPTKYTSSRNRDTGYDVPFETDASNIDDGGSTLWCHFQNTVSYTDPPKARKSSIHIRAKMFKTINVRATAYEMCENHSKKFGGWIYSCTIPSHLVNFTARSAGRFPETVTLSQRTFGNTNDRATLENIQLVPLRKDLKKMVSKRTVDSLDNESVQENFSKAKVEKINLQEKILENTNTLKTGIRFDSKDTTGHRNSESKEKDNRTKTKLQPPRIGVCVPPMYGAVPLQKLVNFIELCNIMGAHKVFLYSHDSPENLLRYLSRYTGQRPEILSLVRWNIPLIPQTLQHKMPSSGTSSSFSDNIASKPGQPSNLSSLDDAEMDEAPPYYSDQTVWNHGQLLAVQHCLYSNMADFDWLLFMDLDEMLVPRNVSSWPELIQQTLNATSTSKTLNPEKLAGLAFQSAFFQQDFRSYVTNSIEYFQYLHRTQQTSSKRSKVLVCPRRVFELGIHHMSKPVVVDEDENAKEKEKQNKDANINDKDTSVLKVPPSVALIHHYRKCVQDPDEPDDKTVSERIRGSAWTEHGWVPLENFEATNGGSNFECNILVKDETVLKYEAELTVISRNVTYSAMKFFARES